MSFDNLAAGADLNVNKTPKNGYQFDGNKTQPESASEREERKVKERDQQLRGLYSR
jgi:hypothetical protein